jgi:hypothetical protein
MRRSGENALDLTSYDGYLQKITQAAVDWARKEKGHQR